MQPVLMLRTKLDQTVHELCLAARFLRNLQAAQGGELHIEIAHLAGSPTNLAEQFEKLFLVAAGFRDELFEQSLEPPSSGAETVNPLRVLAGRELQQVPLRLLEH